MLSHWYEEMEELRESITKTKQRMSEELLELKRQGRDVNDPEKVKVLLDQHERIIYEILPT